jgi:hypothetical protein
MTTRLTCQKLQLALLPWLSLGKIALKLVIGLAFRVLHRVPLRRIVKLSTGRGTGNGEGGVIFSASKRAKHGDNAGGHQKRVGHNISRKACGILRHPVLNMKKIARLSCKDRGEVLKVMGRCVRKRRCGDQANISDPASSQASGGSSASEASDNDWQNWVAVHGNDHQVVEDVQDIGKTIELTFRGGKENMFQVLSRVGKGKGANPSHLTRAGTRKEKSS